jgi:hypothetical protein
MFTPSSPGERQVLSDTDFDRIFDAHNEAPTMTYRYLVGRAIEAATLAALNEPSPPPPAPGVRETLVESIAKQWDGCMYETPGEAIDIGQAIRLAARAAVAAIPLAPDALGAPASPSGSTLQPPAAASAAIPGAVSRDRPTAEPGGCECMECGAIFIGAEWHTVCGVCARDQARSATTEGRGPKDAEPGPAGTRPAETAGEVEKLREALTGVPVGWSLECGVGGFGEKGDRWACIRHLESQCGQDFYEDRDPLIFLFLAALSATQPKE